MIDTDKIAEIIHSTNVDYLGMGNMIRTDQLINAMAKALADDAVEQCWNLVCKDCAGLDPEKRHVPGSWFDPEDFICKAKGEGI